jgi:hypothetical protein
LSQRDRLASEGDRLGVRVIQFSRPYELWKREFGEVQIVPPAPGDRSGQIQTWEFGCSDGRVLCVGQVYERTPGVPWVTIVRVCVAAASAHH